METMICSCCSAKLVPTTLTPFITCEYCDSSIPNPYYDEKAAAEAAKPDAAAICLKLLKELGTAQQLASLDRDCFGDPIDGIDAARAGMAIPDDQQVYFLYSHTFLFVAFSDGLALTDSGVYYACDAGKGSLTWESFVTGAIACVDRNDDQDGMLRLGAGVELAVKGDKDSRLARFLVDFHNQAYRQYTGQTAPAEWTVTTPSVASAAAAQDDPSLLDAVLPGIGTLLGSAVLGRSTSAVPKTVVVRQPAARQEPMTKSAPKVRIVPQPQPGTTKSAPSLRPTSRPTVRQDRRDQVEPARPLHTQPHHRPGMGRPGDPGHPGGSGRPGGASRSNINQQTNALKRMFNEQKPGGSGRSGGFDRFDSERKPGGRGRR